MSLKRYAILAAVSQMQHHQQQQQQQNAIPSATAISGMSGTSATSSTAFATSTTASTLSSSISSPSSEEHFSSSSSFTTYYSSGLGLYHQQRGLANGATSNGGAIAGVGGHATGGSQSYAHVVNGNVNLLLGGAMLSLITTILCVVCYCCHRNIKKRTEAAYRQQQHQWMENDPNMEIYSVEQCYETSGLFLGDSTDGLAAMPTLHHEPPPSYDAVVLHEQQLQQQHQQQMEQQQLQLQLQQQQQLLMQRISPPPGYRSSLDISSLQQQQQQQLLATGGGGGGGLGASGGSSGCCRGTPDGSVDAMALAGSSSRRGGAGEGSLMNKQLERALNAQSCCSLQRAEVENMWNAAAAAVAARSSGNCMEMETFAGGTSSSSSTTTPSAIMAARKQGLNSFGRRYLQQSHQHNHYRRGCPLCGKFRYDNMDFGDGDEHMTMSAMSVESGLNLAATTSEEMQQQQETEKDEQKQEQQPEIEQDNDLANGNITAEISQLVEKDENDNAAAQMHRENDTDTEAVQVENLETAATTSSSSTAQNLDHINDNGIISLDMSKIIDRSGLPTYEGAIKLESSGYV